MQHIRAIQLSEHFNLDMFITIVMELKMNEVTRLKWMEYSNDSQKTHPYSELLKFLNMQAQHFKLVTFEQKPQIIMHRSYKATVERESVWHVEREETIYYELAVSSKACHARNDRTWLRRVPCEKSV